MHGKVCDKYRSHGHQQNQCENIKQRSSGRGKVEKVVAYVPGSKEVVESEAPKELGTVVFKQYYSID